MIFGIDIAHRIDRLMKSNDGKTTTKLGQLLGTPKDASGQAKRKRYAMFLKRLEEDRIFRELRIVAGYLDVSLDVLLGVEQ